MYHVPRNLHTLHTAPCTLYLTLCTLQPSPATPRPTSHPQAERGDALAHHFRPFPLSPPRTPLHAPPSQFGNEEYGTEGGLDDDDDDIGVQGNEGVRIRTDTLINEVNAASTRWWRGAEALPFDTLQSELARNGEVFNGRLAGAGLGWTREVQEPTRGPESEAADAEEDNIWRWGS